MSGDDGDKPSRMVLCEKSCRLVKNVYAYFVREKENLGPLRLVTGPQQRTAEALQLSDATVRKVCSRETFTPMKISRYAPKSHDLPAGAAAEIRDTIYDMYANNEHVTIAKLLAKVHDKQIDIGKTSLHRIIKKLGFRFKRNNNRRFLCAQSHVVVQRVDFLRSYLKNLDSESPLQFIYLDETWIFSKGSDKNTWQDNTIKTVYRRGKTSNGKRHIIVHAGSRQGFVEDAGLIFSTKNKSEDYHDNMNSELFEKWFEESVLMKLEEPSIIILDNARYHSRQEDPNPVASWTKSKIIEWLRKHNIDFEEGELKARLLERTKRHKRSKSYVVDNMALKYGHSVLRLPPYHCEYNPIELVWGISKAYYDKNIVKYSGTDEEVVSLWQEALEQVTTEKWNNCVTHTEKLIREAYEKEVVMDEVLPLFISVNDSESSSSDNTDREDEC